MKTEQPPAVKETVRTPQITVAKELQKASPRESGKKSTSISHPFLDFWFLGGASIVVWAVMMVGQYFRDDSTPVESHYMQLAATFGMLSLVCNHPHFMISYRFGYGRGYRFIFRNWFSLILVPLGLIAAYAVAFFWWRSSISESAWVYDLNRVFIFAGLDFRLGKNANLGMEITSLSVWLMYITVGWHYSKQVFGCMMVYAKYDSYPISKAQRRILKGSVFSIAIFNFTYMYSNWNSFYGSSMPSYFQYVPLTPIGLPRPLTYIAAVALCGLSIAVIYGVCYRNYKQFGKVPSPNFLIAWIAYHLWAPILPQKEFYIMVVPFFHSLQYLPFAYRLELAKTPKTKRFYGNISMRLIILLVIGFLAFEGVPTWLDNHFQTNFGQVTWFFVTAFAVFINVHHFFIDSVAWKLDEPEVKNGLFYESA